MNEDIEAIERNDTWDLVDLSIDKNRNNVSGCIRQI